MKKIFKGRQQSLKGLERDRMITNSNNFPRSTIFLSDLGKVILVSYTLIFKSAKQEQGSLWEACHLNL